MLVAKAGFPLESPSICQTPQVCGFSLHVPSPWFLSWVGLILTLGCTLPEGMICASPTLHVLP